MKYNPMSVDDYEAIGWLEERSKELPALNNAWIILKNYYEECKNELNRVDYEHSPYEDSKERDNVYAFVEDVLSNDTFMREAEEFLKVSRDELTSIITNKKYDSKSEWLIAKTARLYNMHLKLGHSARITFVAEQGLQNIEDGENTELLKRTVLLSALLHDVGRFYQAAHYNDLSDARMKKNELQIDGLDVDHAIAGYYYSLASALELHKLEDVLEDEEITRYVTEAIAAVVVKHHQISNSLLSHFDYGGSSSVLRNPELVSELRTFMDSAYDQAKLMNLDMDSKIDSKQKLFINRFIDKIKSILYDKELDYTVASGFEYDQNYTDLLYTELNREVQDIFLHAQGKDVNTLSDQIVDVVNHKIMELSHEELKEEEKEQYKQEIIESLQGMLDYDVASSINEIFKSGENIPPSVRFLISSSMSMTMDADKIDILNQRALGIYNTSYKVNSFDVFPPDQMSLREILNQYFHFHLDGDSFTLDNKALSVIRNMHSSVFEMIKKQIGNIPISTADRIVVYKDKVIADGVEYPSQELYTMFNDEWNSYVSRNMNFEHTDFKSFKKEHYKELQIGISRDVLDDNIKDYSDEERIRVYRNLLVSDGLKKRFMLEEKNGIQSGWIHQTEDTDTDHIVHNSITGLIWQLNQFIMVNMRNKNSYHFIEKYHMLDQIYEQYEKKDPLIASVVGEYIDYCKMFMDYTLQNVHDDTLTSDELSEIRNRVYLGSGDEKSTTYQ